jgi:hypothetical protein
VELTCGAHENRCPPLRYVTESTVRETPDERHSSQSFVSLLWSEGFMFLLYLVSFFMVLLNMVPSYELWMNVIQPASVWIAVPTLAMMLAAQTTALLVLHYVLSLAGLGGTSCIGRSKPWNEAFYGVYHSCNWGVQNWTMMSVFWGTPIVGFVLNLLGANVDGRFLYFDSTHYEIPYYLSVADRTVSDWAKLLGHSAVFSNITLGPVRVSGILHENTVAMAKTPLSLLNAREVVRGGTSRVTRLNTERPRALPKKITLPKGPTLKLRFEIVSTGACLETRVERYLVCKWEITGQLEESTR